MRKKEKSNRAAVFFAVFLVAIMVFSMGGYFLGSAPSTVEYNNHKFIADMGGYIYNVNGGTVLFTYFPDQLESLYFPPEASQLLSGRPMIYVTYDPESPLSQDIASSQFRMQSALSRSSEVYIQPALTVQTNYSLPAVGCENSTAFVPVVLFENSTSANLTMSGACIIIAAKRPNEVRAYTERIMYTILGVME